MVTEPESILRSPNFFKMEYSSKFFVNKIKKTLVIMTHPVTGFSNRCDGVVVRAFASQSVDLGFISEVESYQTTLKNDIDSFPAWRSENRDGVENKPACLFVAS